MKNTIEKGYTKRIFTFIVFVKDFVYLITRLFSIINAVFLSKEINKKFREKIMMIVSSVNGCVYCSWFHAKVAIFSGMNTEEMKEVMNLQFNPHTGDKELTALLYAQHYAETNRNPEEVMEDKLVTVYGNKTAKQIKLLIRLMFFTNLQGNTFDAFISRLKGIPAKNSNIIFEFFFFLINIPFILPLKPFINNNNTT